MAAGFLGVGRALVRDITFIIGLRAVRRRCRISPCCPGATIARCTRRAIRWFAEVTVSFVSTVLMESFCQMRRVRRESPRILSALCEQGIRRKG